VTPEELAAEIASPEAARVRRAVAACAAYLRSDDLSDDRGALVEILLGVLGHRDPEVRQGIAEVCELFAHAPFSRAFEALSTDPDAFVRKAATNAGERRARRRKARAKNEEREHVLEEILAEIDGTFGPEGRRLASRAARRTLELFAARLDHELGKPRDAIARALETLRVEIDKPDRSPAKLRALVDDAGRGFSFVDAIVRRTRAYAAPFTPAFRVETVADVVAEARAQLFARAGELAPRIDVTLDGDLGVTAHLDRNALLQALQNVLQNAVEAYAPDATGPLAVGVSIQSLTRGTEIEIVVRDRGRGMSEGQKKNLFVPLGSTKPGGSGLGLLVARKMIEEAHAGTFTIPKSDGAGTTVRMLLPATQLGTR
jgi:signal transduction histidine kinase